MLKLKHKERQIISTAKYNTNHNIFVTFSLICLIQNVRIKAYHDTTNFKNKKKTFKTF